MDLHLLGWSAHWRDLFEPYLSQSLFPVASSSSIATRIASKPKAASDPARSPDGCAIGPSADLDLPAVGDFVAVRLPESNAGDGPAIVEAVLPRRTAFVRRAAGGRPDDQVIAANIDTVFVMTGLDHDFNVRRAERYLAAVWESGANRSCS